MKRIVRTLRRMLALDDDMRELKLCVAALNKRVTAIEKNRELRRSPRMGIRR